VAFTSNADLLTRRRWAIGVRRRWCSPDEIRTRYVRYGACILGVRTAMEKIDYGINASSFTRIYCSRKLGLLEFRMQ
jgi:hypothetical protein